MKKENTKSPQAPNITKQITGVMEESTVYVERTSTKAIKKHIKFDLQSFEAKDLETRLEIICSLIAAVKSNTSVIEDSSAFNKTIHYLQYKAAVEAKKRADFDPFENYARLLNRERDDVHPHFASDYFNETAPSIYYEQISQLQRRMLDIESGNESNVTGYSRLSRVDFESTILAIENLPLHERTIALSKFRSQLQEGTALERNHFDVVDYLYYKFFLDLKVGMPMDPKQDYERLGAIELRDCYYEFHYDADINIYSTLIETLLTQIRIKIAKTRSS